MLLSGRKWSCSGFYSVIKLNVGISTLIPSSLNIRVRDYIYFKYKCMYSVTRNVSLILILSECKHDVILFLGFYDTAFYDYCWFVPQPCGQRWAMPTQISALPTQFRTAATFRCITRCALGTKCQRRHQKDPHNNQNDELCTFKMKHNCSRLH